MHWNDVTLEDLLEFMLNEDLEGQKAMRGQFIKNKLGSQWHGLHGYENIDQFIEKLGEVDPTRNGAYMAWMARLAITKPTENRAEDLDRIGQDLQAFEANKARIQNKDINAYKSFQELFDVIAPFLKPQKKTKADLAKEKDAARLAKVKADIETVYAGPEGWIRIPKTIEAAKFLGQNTRWCTASDKSNMFKYYDDKDKLFVIYDKASKARFQLHVQSGQFADEADRNRKLDAVPEWARKPIIEWYKKNVKLTPRQMLNLSSLSDENLAAGTEHEALFDLMKQFGI